MKAFKIGFLFILFPLWLYAQKSKYDSTYIETYTEYLTLRNFLMAKINQVAIQRTTPEGTQMLLYRPNNQLTWGLGFNYKWLGLNFAVLSVADKDHKKYGSTSQMDMQSQIMLRRFVGNVHLIRYSGFYLENAPQELKSHEKIRPDLQTMTMGLSMYYILNHKKFSFRSVTLQNEIQKKSAGSVLLGGYHTFMSFKADSSMIPKDMESTFKDHVDSRRYVALHYGLGGGYAHNFVFKKHFFANISLVLGMGWQQKIIYFRGERQESMDFSSKINSRMAVGYHSPKFFVLLVGTLDNYLLSKTEELRSSYNMGNLRLVAGLRLAKFWKKQS